MFGLAASLQYDMYLEGWGHTLGLVSFANEGMNERTNEGVNKSKRKDKKEKEGKKER